MRVAFICLAFLLGANAAAVTRVTYYHTDYLGSPVAATNAQGEELWRATYRPYGDRTQSSVDHLAAVNNPLWYTGHEQDMHAGLIYMQARYFQPLLGRFLSADPQEFSAAEPGSFNRFAYALNSPYRYVDPDGREAILVSLRGTAATGVGVSGSTGLFVTYPGSDNTPWDIGWFGSIAAVAGADVSATVNVALLGGGREDIDGSHLTTSATLPLTGVAGPSIDAEYTINPVTGESVGAALGLGVALFPNASVSAGTGSVSLSVRDVLGLSTVVDSQSVDPPMDDDLALQTWFDHIAM